MANHGKAAKYAEARRRRERQQESDQRQSEETRAAAAQMREFCAKEAARAKDAESYHWKY